MVLIRATVIGSGLEWIENLGVNAAKNIFRFLLTGFRNRGIFPLFGPQSPVSQMFSAEQKKATIIWMKTDCYLSPIILEAGTTMKPISHLPQQFSGHRYFESRAGFVAIKFGRHDIDEALKDSASKNFRATDLLKPLKWVPEQISRPSEF